MDGIKLTFCGTESAADAFIFIHDRSSASETAACLDLDLFFRERRTQIAEGLFCDSGFFTRYLSFCRVKFFDVKVVFIKLDKLTEITAKCQRVAFMYKAVDGYAALFSGSNRINGEFRPGKDITADKNIRLCGLMDEALQRCLLTDCPRGSSVRWRAVHFHIPR